MVKRRLSILLALLLVLGGISFPEKSYAAGKIPGGFPRREGRPTEHETLTARLIDRPLRPLFPEGFYNEEYIILFRRIFVCFMKNK